MSKQNLKFFVLQGESKRLYKRFMKLTRRVEDRQQQKDLRYWIRDDFKINKNLTDEVRRKVEFRSAAEIY